MKVLLINGSPHKEGNTFLALSEAASVREQQYRGFSVNGTYDDSEVNTGISDKNYTYNVWRQTGDGFIEID